MTWFVDNFFIFSSDILPAAKMNRIFLRDMIKSISLMPKPLIFLCLTEFFNQFADCTISLYFTGMTFEPDWTFD